MLVSDAASCGTEVLLVGVTELICRVEMLRIMAQRLMGVGKQYREPIKTALLLVR